MLIFGELMLIWKCGQNDSELEHHISSIHMSPLDKLTVGTVAMVK